MLMQELNLPKINIKSKLVDESIQIFDIVRKKYLLLTAEEWVRQHVVHYLIFHKNYPKGLMQIEKLIKYNSLKTRADILVLDTNSNPLILVECKAPSVSIDKDAFFQIAKYNSSLKAKYLFVTNGLNHYCCEMDYESGATNYLKEVPKYLN
tara:strand:- start:417 stop:869 length:453 start_codon:yes stop_codon:yes gene_type:complete